MEEIKRYRFSVDGAVTCYENEDGPWILYADHLKVLYEMIDSTNALVTELETQNSILAGDRDNKAKEISSLKVELGEAYHISNKKTDLIESLSDGGAMIPSDSTGGGGGGIE